MSRLGDFVECTKCAAKSGQPPLCQSCLSNRATIERLYNELNRQDSILRIVRDVLQLKSI